MQERFESLPEEYSHLYLAIEGKLAAVICIEDPLREEAADVVAALKWAGFKKVVMMTGDSERTARSIASKVEIADITIDADHLSGLVTLKSISDGLMGRIRKNYFRIIGINSGLILLGVGGLVQPTTSALVHNASTLAISLSSMKSLLE